MLSCLVQAAGCQVAAPGPSGTTTGTVDHGASGGITNTSDGRDGLARPLTLVGGTVVNMGARDVMVDSNGHVELGTPGQFDGTNGTMVDVSGQHLMPAYVDAHVHLEYYDVRASLPGNGILAAVDLAAPIASLDVVEEPLLLELSAGPMLTAPGGYPTRGWGRNGFGWELATVDEARSAAMQLLERGAALLKVPFSAEPYLSDEQVQAIVGVAHAAGKKVAAHALGDEQAARARALGCDILAHTPTEPLSASTVEAWSGGTVISTLAAFGAGDAAIENLTRLRQAGTLVLYGTDLGNLQTSSLARSELDALMRAGVSGGELLATFTTAPAEYFGIDVGTWKEGGPAHFVVLAGDPLLDPDQLIEPLMVVSNTTVLRSD